MSALLFQRACMWPEYNYDAPSLAQPLPGGMGPPIPLKDAVQLAHPNATRVAGWHAMPVRAGVPDIFVVVYQTPTQNGCFMAAPKELPGDEFATSFFSQFDPFLSKFEVKSFDNAVFLTWLAKFGADEYDVTITLMPEASSSGFIAEATQDRP
ncbi:hypothetical protein D2T31_00500 [Sinirhodobacter populi]|uniref:Uncharacterized protein n=1 Tax=Paenirhodobacter populi TaxID=2306993 RepID=A0A443KIA9_9RHOB|nr:hypothetical protein [Sinirhodobacter populi]RWR32497.1 hypothetical protein D2T31_00500 [Sinirhodobacter populi]